MIRALVARTFTILYSGQSDRESQCCKNFIRIAADDAARRVGGAAGCRDCHRRRRDPTRIQPEMLRAQNGGLSSVRIRLWLRKSEIRSVRRKLAEISLIPKSSYKFWPADQCSGIPASRSPFVSSWILSFIRSCLCGFSFSYTRCIVSIVYSLNLVLKFLIASSTSGPLCRVSA